MKVLYIAICALLLASGCATPTIVDVEHQLLKSVRGREAETPELITYHIRFDDGTLQFIIKPTAKKRK